MMQVKIGGALWNNNWTGESSGRSGSGRLVTAAGIILISTSSVQENCMSCGNAFCALWSLVLARSYIKHRA
jgi:hypothetical protein